MTAATPPHGRTPLAWLRAAAALLLAAALLAGCQQRPSFRIGYLDGQPDSALMAHMVAESLRRAGARSVLSPCPTPVACGHQLQAGDLDLLPEYSGTARVFFQSAEIAGGALPSVRRALADAGLAATPGLGFEAPYKLLMRRVQAEELEIDSIEGLSELDRLRFAVPPGYARQPGDGLFALARRYGLEIAPEQVAELRAPAERIARLLAGEVELAVVRAPDLRQPSLVTLKDTLNFYPRYEATVVLGSETVPHQRFVERTLSPLFGRVTAEVVQPLLIEQVLHGRDPAPLASRVLVRLGVLDATGPSVRRPEMTVVHGVGEEMGELGGQALLTVRRAFPERPVNVVQRNDPASALETGAADLAIVHTSDFFRLDWSGSYAGRDPRLEAIAPVGRRPFLMVLRADTAQAPRSPLSARVGVQPGWTAGGRVAARMLSLAGQRPHARAASGQLIAAVKAGELDAAVLLLDPGARAALQGLTGNQVQVSGVSRWLPAPPFFLNEQRLPAKAVPGALTPVDTLSMQLLLAAPSPGGRGGAVHGGPASAVATGSLPLPLDEAKALAAASEAAEPLEPVLPSFRERAATAERARNGPTALLETALVLAALVYLAWAGRLLARSNRPPV